MKLGYLIPAVLLLLTPLAFADDAGKLAKIDEIFRLTRVDQLEGQIMGQMKSILAQQNARIGDSQKAQAMDNEVMKLISDRLSWAKIKPEFEKMYAETFSDAELDGMLSFYQSPTGKAVVEKMPSLMQKSMAWTQQQMTAVMPEVTQIIQKYKGQTPPPAAK